MKGEGRHLKARWSLFGFVVKRESRLGSWMEGQWYWRRWLADRVAAEQPKVDGRHWDESYYQGA